MNWFEIENESQVDSPSLLIFEDRVRHNIREAIRMTGNVSRLRPHVKTHKNAETAKLMMEEGITRFKCATIREAEMLGNCGAADVLLSYQLTGPKIARYIELIKRFPRTLFSCLIDNPYTAQQLSEAFAANGLRVAVYIDIDAGMHRTGISPGADAVSLYQLCSGLDGLSITGLHAYDGHQRHPSIDTRKEMIEDAFEAVLDTRKELVSMGLGPIALIAGGSPGFPVHAAHDDRECSPGTFVYWDAGYMEICPEQDFLPAAVLMTRVISVMSNRKICTDLGHKGVAAENEISKRMVFLNADRLSPVSQSEEHLVLEVSEPASYKPGDVLYALPYHVCPTVALYDSVQVVRNNRVEEQWEVVARAR